MKTTAKLSFLLLVFCLFGCGKSTAASLSMPQSVYINVDSLQLTQGEHATLYFTALPSESAELFSWSSFDESIATVDTEGTVTAIGEGTTKILISEPSGISAVCVVTVSPISVIDMLNDDEYMVYDGVINASGTVFRAPESVRIEKAYYYNDNDELGSATSFLLYLRGENGFGGNTVNAYGLIYSESTSLLISAPDPDLSSYTLATATQIDVDKINNALDEYWDN
jgi:hypothetical protein